MQEVGARVVAADGVAPVAVDAGPDLLAGQERPLLDHALVTGEARCPPGGVEHPEGAGVAAQLSGVAHLPAPLGVEGGAVEDNLDMALAA